MAQLNKPITVDIAASASLSGAMRLDGLVPIALQMPSSWTTANLTFQGSADGTTYYSAYDYNGSEITVVAAASEYIVLNPQIFAGFKYLKVRSGTAGTPVNQAAAREILLVMKNI